MKFISNTGFNPVNQEDKDATDKDSLPQPHLKRIPSVDGSCVISDEDYTTRHRRYRF